MNLLMQCKSIQKTLTEAEFGLAVNKVWHESLRPNHS